MSKQFEVRTLVSVVSYCSSDLICRMLPGLMRQIDKAQDRIVIVDNQSPDGSFGSLLAFVDSSGWTEFIDVILADRNGGFSYGNNFAIKYAVEKYQTTPSYVWLLNPDTKLLENALINLFNFFDAHPKAGILGSRLEGEDGELQGSAFRFHTLKSELLSGLRLGITDKLFSKYLVSPKEIPSEPAMVEWLAGASMLIRYSVIEDIGLMDEQYFLYFEETDFCLQAHKFGWQSWYLPSSRIIHYVGQSTGIVSGDSLRRRRPKYWFQSRQYYLIKNHGIVYTALADLAWGGMFTVHKVLDFIRLRFHNDPMYLWRDFWRNSIFLSWLDRK